MSPPNRLAQAQSPYLLQHKDNPVDWYEWGPEAFEKAQAEDKPVFLSVGYSTCHWCHVMAHESFEDEAVARLMNEAFVSIKVDREERPDIDNLYMMVCQMATGRGGWPLTIVMTPDQKPFFAATYIPKQSRHGSLGMLELIPRLQQAWQDRRTDVVSSADNLVAALQEAEEAQAGAPEGALDAEALRNAYHQLAQRYDAAHGGFGEAPKFPSPHNLLFLLRHTWRTGDDDGRRMAVHTLEQMRLGGVYDHVGFGFHRYATDAEWRLPHFEKMLYDQALLTLAYVEAYQATGRRVLEQTAREVITYVLRDLAAPEGGFYAAEDADSEGREGAFYLWTLDDVRAVLEEETELAVRAYNLAPEGNFEEEATRRKTGENVLFRTEPVEALAEAYGLPPGALQRRLDAVRERLFDRRSQRVRPGRDDKILTDWNGLMIAALAKAAAVLDAPAYAEAARQAAGFLLDALRLPDGRLLHRYREGEAGIQANLDDYAFLTWGLLELYEATFEIRWLDEALALCDQQRAHFQDERGGGFFFTPDDGEALLVRRKEFYDGAVPSGNAVTVMNLLRLGRLTGRTELEQQADAVLRGAAGQVQAYPGAFTALLMGLGFALGPSCEVVIAGARDDDDTQAMLRALQSRYVPNKVLLLRPAAGEAPELARLAPFVAAQQSRDGVATAYVCQNYQCHQPTTDPDEMLRLLPGTV